MTLRRLVPALLALPAAFLMACSDAGYAVPRGPTGLFSLVILVLDIVAIVKILQGGSSAANKLLWIIVILLLPLLGLILWYLLGRK